MIYGYDLPDATVEIVNLRLVATAAPDRRPNLSFAEDVAPARSTTARILDKDGAVLKVPVLARAALKADAPHAGPLLIRDHGATIRHRANGCGRVPRGCGYA